jgi:CMP-N,N'-diacetyllegionaminic acid synthase
MKKVLAIIPARGGSKGLRGKNIIDVCGKPMIAWSIEAAQKCSYTTTIIVSTDDEKIKLVAEQYGVAVPVLRPAHLSQDETLSSDVLLHCINENQGYDTICMLQPTSPLRTAGDLDDAFRLFNESGAPACVSVVENEYSPYWSFHIVNKKLNSLFPLKEIPLRRQDLQPTYSLNGAIYIANIEWFKEKKSFLSNDTASFVMPIERSLDIDTVVDLKIARKLLTKHS